MCIYIASGLRERLYEVENVVIAVGVFFLLYINLRCVRFRLLLLHAVARALVLSRLSLDSRFFFVFCCDLRPMRFSIHSSINLLPLILLIRFLPINLHSISFPYINLLLANSIISTSIYLPLLPTIITALLPNAHPTTIHLPQYAPNQLLHPPPLVHQHIINLPLYPLIHLFLPFHHSIE